ncbi:UDP-N-acetylmuramoyl-L-alanyl-D-glutamate--2,6-diaminopimelate ligase [Alicyclobacillus macrosporangiidus]|uniref:UDP-N-acetylmuramoyl-L-alanyl-D-glutamate--2,6-diaminopimelate ligase n=1 Tax=Alicyclobacillus macrosporangiidus TaxID=392015 RepID=A0A1I7HAR9_9BACL|nr:UDP-N-acetylmuramoyl-L-alanyl-D-glutamate--2,6-diaminopimelate ligase [Alicyclobacillus macrosporangiidus]SFU57810.1 UDP-N-acetylmuramoyl-L-alanyl-D-glutamate--2,6-diaminopimelate ligase [Alicyclobacillus macrosporangiidus]
MQLQTLIRPLLKRTWIHPADVEITSLTADSRSVEPGALFIAIRGYTVDGHDFAAEAVRRGARALLVERPLDLPVTQVVVPDTRLASAIVADVFYRHPSQRLQVIGVTGTSGKTTVTHLIEHLLNQAGYVTGLYGTVGKRIAGVTEEVVNTTPEAVELQAVLHEMAERGCRYGIMEVSSHALELRRVAGTRYHIAVFTNLSQDHLDFHGTMDNYRMAKGKLFSRLGNVYGDDLAGQSFAVLNADDEASAYMAAQTVAECVTYGIEREADVRATDVQVRPEGVRFHVRSFAGEADVALRLTGRFNVYNALAALSVAVIEGISLPEAAAALAEVRGIPGRLERVGAGCPVTVLVDYSHKPDSLEKALATVREFAHGRLWCVVGCGGDRDRGKRPVMARIACDWSDEVILTSDNPRTEDPERILDDMVAGVADRRGWRRITDRAAAIRTAIAEAAPGDVVFIAGKGHETYQIVGREKIHFDDREVARAALRDRFGEAAGRGEG